MSLQEFVLVLLCIFGVYSLELEVEIGQGILRGDTRVNLDNETYLAFKNIPYAKPPVGELRFKAPQPAEGWTGVRDATTEVPVCAQAVLGGIAVEGQEDCLYLNIYTPELPNENSTLKPVLVFIHGGSFVMGSAVENDYGAQFLLTQDVVLVAPNYRLGLFGFLSSDEPKVQVPGNAGLRDQNMALRWVNQNIHHFGGDPNNVLLFGQSAGGVAVHLQVLSPLSSGLFHSAILESGTAMAMVYNGTRDSFRLLADFLGVNSEDGQEALTSLQNLPTEMIILGQQILATVYSSITAPIVEKEFEEPAFISATPRQIIRSGNYNDVPLLIGVNDAEGLLYELTSILLTGQSMLITDFTGFVPRELHIEPGSEEEQMISDQIRVFYFDDVEPTRENITGAVNLYTDFAFAYPAYVSTLEHLETINSSIYFYYFTVDAALNFAKLMIPTTAAFPGAAHSDELGYLFHNFVTLETIEELEMGILRNMVGFWTGFARNHNPTADMEGLDWRPVDRHEYLFNCFNIGTNNMSMDVSFRYDNMQFWSRMFEKHLPSE